jgi:hypothetical protein
VSSTEVLDVGNQHEPTWAELGLSKDQIVDRLRAQLGEIEVLAVWPNDQLPPRSVRRWLTKEEAAAERRRRKRGGNRARG